MTMKAIPLSGGRDAGFEVIAQLDVLLRGNILRKVPVSRAGKGAGRLRSNRQVRSQA